MPPPPPPHETLGVLCYVLTLVPATPWFMRLHSSRERRVWVQELHLLAENSTVGALVGDIRIRLKTAQMYTMFYCMGQSHFTTNLT